MRKQKKHQKNACKTYHVSSAGAETSGRISPLTAERCTHRWHELLHVVQTGFSSLLGSAGTTKIPTLTPSPPQHPACITLYSLSCRLNAQTQKRGTRAALKLSSPSSVSSASTVSSEGAPSSCSGCSCTACASSDVQSAALELSELPVLPSFADSGSTSEVSSP